MTLYEIITAAKEELAERINDADTDIIDESDIIHEIADSSVPVYNNDLISLAYHDMSLAVDEPELGPAFDGTPTPINIIAANVYEAITAALYELLYDLQPA